MAALGTARRLFLWTHMLIGLVFALYTVLLGGSGALLVFREELNAMEFPRLHNGEPKPVRTTPDQALAAVQAANPGWQTYSLTWPNESSPHWMSYIGRGGRSIEVFVDTAKGRVVGGRDTHEGFTGTLALLHFNLLLGGRAGTFVQGCGIVALLAMCASGLLLWWPAGGARFASRFRVDLRGGWQKLSWQLHHVTGAAGIAFIAMWAVTGGYYIWMNSYIAVVDRFFERALTPQVQTPPDAKVLSMTDLASIAQAQFPNRALYRMAVPSPGQAVLVTMLESTPAEFHRVATVILDPMTGAVLQKGASANRPAGNSILGWISVLHFGRFGGFAVRVLWFLMGLTLPLLAGTGCLMWWRRVIRPQLGRVE